MEKSSDVSFVLLVVIVVGKVEFSDKMRRKSKDVETGDVKREIGTGN